MAAPPAHWRDGTASVSRRAVLLLVMLWRGNGHPISQGGTPSPPAYQPGLFFPSHCDIGLLPNDACAPPPPPPAVALFSLDTDEGIAYLQVQRTEAWREGGAAGAERDWDNEDSAAAGWVEVYQEGHRLMANFSGSEISIAVGGIDTYLWASVFDSRGRWIAQSNVLHTGGMLFCLSGSLEGHAAADAVLVLGEAQDTMQVLQ